MENDGTNIIAALLYVLERGVVVNPRVPGRPDAGWHIALASEERPANDHRPEGWIGGLGG